MSDEVYEPKDEQPTAPAELRIGGVELRTNAEGRQELHAVDESALDVESVRKFAGTKQPLLPTEELKEAWNHSAEAHFLGFAVSEDLDAGTTQALLEFHVDAHISNLKIDEAER